MRTPWGPGKVSCIESCPHFRGKFTLRKRIWDTAKYPYALFQECPLALFQECPLAKRGPSVYRFL